MFPWNNMQDMLVIAAAEVLKSLLGKFSAEAATRMLRDQGPEKAKALMLGIYRALGRLAGSSRAFRAALFSWERVSIEMQDHNLKYAPQWAQSILLESIHNVEKDILALQRAMGTSDLLTMYFPGFVEATNEAIQTRALHILEPQQFVDNGTATTPKDLFIARIDWLVQREDDNIEVISRLRDEVAAYIRKEFALKDLL